MATCLPDSKGILIQSRGMANGKPIKSRLDRLYIAKDKTNFTFDWMIEPSSVPTDHWLVTVKYAPKKAPLERAGGPSH